MSRPRWKRTFFWTVAALLAAGIVAPILVTLNFWHGAIAGALSNGLGRRASIGAVHPKLFGGLGFEIDNAVLEDDPRFGAEPFARIETLKATIAPSTLWKGRLIFSNLTFVSPHLNVVRMTSGPMAGHWNVESLGVKAIPPSVPPRSTPLASGSPFEPLPRIVVDGGRINYKTDDRKRVYLIDDLDMEIAPATSAAEPWRMSFEGRPKRADFPVNPESRFRGQASFGPFPMEGDTLAHVDIAAEKAFVGDILKIVTGADEGVHGWIDLNLHLAGTTSLLRISGTADMRDLHRWDRIPTSATKVLHADVAAVLDLDRDLLEIRSAAVPVGKGKATLSGEVYQLFHQPRPNLSFSLLDLPISDVADIAKQFTGRLDSGLAVGGTLNGAFRWSASSNTPPKGYPLSVSGNFIGDSVDGSIRVAGAHFELKGNSQAMLSDTEFVAKGSAIHAGPAFVSFGDRGKLQWSFDGDLEKKRYEWRLEAAKMPLPPLLAWTRAIGSRWGRAPFSKGDVALRLSYQWNEGRPSLTGTVDVSAAQLDSRAISQPVRVANAHFDLRPEHVVIKPLSATAGKLEWTGSMTANVPAVSAEVSTPVANVEFDWRTPAIDLADLTQLFNISPLQRLFPFGAKEPPPSEFFHWISATGTIETPSLRYRGQALRNFKARMLYQNRILEIEQFKGELARGTHTGTATIRFDGKEPRFDIGNRFAGVDAGQLASASPDWSGYFGGKIGGSLRVQGAGRTAEEIVESLSGWGEVSGSGVDLRGIDLAGIGPMPSPVMHIAALDSKFQISKKHAVIKEMKITVESPADAALGARIHRGSRLSTWTVTGRVGFDRTIDVVSTERTSSAKQSARESRWTGTMAKPVVEFRPAAVESAQGQPPVQ